MKMRHPENVGHVSKRIDSDATEAHNKGDPRRRSRPPCPEIYTIYTKVGFQFSYANSTPASIRSGIPFRDAFHSLHVHA